MCGGYRYSALAFTVIIIWILFLRNASPEAIRCCNNYANGSCRSACEKLSLVSAATNPDEFQSSLQKLSNLCHKTFMATFWNCLNETLNEINRGDGWLGRPCCNFPGSEKCRMACLQAQSISDLLPACRKSDEIAFFTCLEKQEAGEKCCREAKTINCSRVCREVFESSFTPTKEVRYAINKYCSQEIQQCTRMYTRVTPADNAYRNLHCCEMSTNSQCRTNCRRILEDGKIAEEIVDNLRKGGCGDPQVQDRLWQCFLTNSKDNVEPGGSLILSEKAALDSAKLQCCFRAANVNCQRLCSEMFTHPWTTSLKDFDRLCQYQLAESEMVRCLAEVDEPCELGCEGLTYCTNFNYRPTELFRSCDVIHDNAARADFMLWAKGSIYLPMMTIPVLNISECHPEIWKAIACTLQIKPCVKDAHVNMICKSDCIDILTKCVDRKRLTPGQTPYTLCEVLSPPGNDTPCIQLSTYLVESNHGENALEVTHPCRPNRCGSDEICMVNRNCHFEQPCYPYVCAPGCRMGDMSQLVVPRNSFVRILSNTDGPKCHMVCFCNHRGQLEDCETQPCSSNEYCIVDGHRYNHNTHFKIDCNECFCYGGEVTCSKKQCGSGLPCNCPDHYVPVCGANGKTYPSACLARCAGLSDDDFEFGACYESDPCSPNSCHPYDRCVPRKRVCLSIRHKSCKQYDCVNMQARCGEQPKSPVCDTDNIEHLNICWLLQRRKSLAHYGKCMHHCRGHDSVCGHNGETYASECAAWAERVPVDYKGPCAAVGASYGTQSRCSGIKCPPLPSEHCTKVFPPGGCCPICGAAIRVLYSQKLSDSSVEAVRDVEPVVVQTIANKLREHVKVTECEVFAYLSIETDIIVLFTAITDNPTQLQVEACITEAEKVHILIHEHSPTLLTELPLSFITSATMIDPVTDGIGRCLPRVTLLCVLLFTAATIQRIL